MLNKEMKMGDAILVGSCLRRLCKVMIIAVFLLQTERSWAGAPAPYGGGISTETYRFAPYSFETTYPADWVVEGVVSEKKNAGNSGVSGFGGSGCGDLVDRLKSDVTCQEALIRSPQTPQSWVRILYLYSNDFGSLEKILEAGKIWAPDVVQWKDFPDGRYAAGYSWDSTSAKSTRSFEFKDIFFPGENLGVFVAGQGFDDNNGIFGINLIRNGISRLGQGLELKSFWPEKRKITAGEFACYNFNVTSVGGGLSRDSISSISSSDLIAQVRQKFRLVKMNKAATEAVLQGCFSTTPRGAEVMAQLDSVNFISSLGTTLFCSLEEAEALRGKVGIKGFAKIAMTSSVGKKAPAVLSCVSSLASELFNGELPAKPLRVSGEFVSVTNPNPDTTGPEILSLEFDKETREIRIRAKDEGGLSSAYFYADEQDGTILTAHDWRGKPFGLRHGSWLTPGEKSSKREGELRVSITRFKGVGPMVLRAGRITDTLGNSTDFFLPLQKRTPKYDVNQRGGIRFEMGPVIDWISLGEDR